MSRVAAAQRFTAAHPCPVCGGHDGLPRGESVRCAGFRSDDGGWAHCTREEHAGGLRLHVTSQTYAHRLDVPCRCGRAHNAAGRLHAAQPVSNGPAPAARLGEPVATYDYRALDGRVVHRTLRYDPKEFRQCRPDPARLGAWLPNLDGVDLVLYRLPEIQGQADVVIVEGEKDADALATIGFAASCNAMGAGKWRPEYARQLAAAGAQRVAVLPDNDRPGQTHAATVIATCLAHRLIARLVTLPGLPAVGDRHGEDVSDWLAQGHTAEELRAVIDAAMRPEPKATPWARAVSVADFLAQEDHEVAWLEEHVLAPGSLTEIFAPRGLGKSHVLHGILVKLARRGTRCLLLDRDNSRREVKRRLRAWGAADLPALRVMLRDDVPPLTDTKAWAQFPFAEYDVVAIDSLDASAEGVGEQDSSKPSRALAPILDLCHRAAGPAIVTLGNVIKSGAHSRGSGVVEDRADIAYEVRDCTDLTPSGTKDWWQELPPAGAENWAARASRRKRRDTYRLAFVPSKFRIGEEPEPFAYELNLGGVPWSLRLCTDEILTAGREAQETVKQQRQAHLEQAAAGLCIAMTARTEASHPPMTSAEAEGYLKAEHHLRRTAARALLTAHEGTLWAMHVDAARPGRPKFWQPIPGPQAPFGGGPAAEIPRRESPALTPSDEGDISADRMDRARQKYAPTESRINGGDPKGGISAAASDLKDAPAASEDRL